MKKTLILLFTLFFAVVVNAIPVVQLGDSISEITCGTAGTCSEVYKGTVALNTSAEQNASMEQYVLYVNSTNAAGTGSAYDDTWINGTIDEKDVAANSSLIPYILYVNSTNAAGSGSAYDDAWINATRTGSLPQENISGSKWINYSNLNASQIEFTNNNVTIKQSWLDTLYFKIEDWLTNLGLIHTNMTLGLTALNESKLNVSDQRFNESTDIVTLNNTKLSITALDGIQQNITDANVSSNAYADTRDVFFNDSIDFPVKTDSDSYADNDGVTPADNVSDAPWINDTVEGNLSVTGNISVAGQVHANTPAVGIYNSAGQTLTNGQWRNLNFSAERFDTDNMWNAAGPVNSLVANTAGVYQISTSLRFGTSNTGGRAVLIQVNGVTVAVDFRANAALGADMFAISAVWKLNVGDKVEVLAYQASGGNLNVDAIGSYSPNFAMVRIG